MIAPVSIFFSYASQDEKLCDELEKHLTLLQHQGIITTWHNRKIPPGTNWAGTIDTHLNDASIILLLISSDFLASDYCYKSEMHLALERHRLGTALVIPIILRPVDWSKSPFAHLQYLPHNAQPITLWNNQDAAFREVAEGIRQAVEHLHSTPSLSQTERHLFTKFIFRNRKRTRAFMIIIFLIFLVFSSLSGWYVYTHRDQLSPSNNTTTSTVQPSPTPFKSIADLLPSGWHIRTSSLSANDASYFNWNEGDGLYTKCEFQDNSYYVGIEGGAIGYAFCLANTPTQFTDFAFQVDMKDKGRTGGGIVFHFGHDSGYYFCVQYTSDNQVIAFVKTYTSGKFITLKRVSLSDLNVPFYKNPADLNTLAVVVRGNTFTFFVNNEKAMEMEDTLYPQGQIGLGAGNAADQLSYAGVEMSNAKLWTP